MQIRPDQAQAATATGEAPPSTIVDTRGRPLRDLRISVTDRCNFRCTYCMPKEVFGKDFQFLDREQLLTFGEIHRLTRIFRDQGIEKVRITGGEPLVRRKLERLIEMLAYHQDLDLTLTTNGSLLKQKAADLKAAGLKRVTVSLDALDNETFMKMNDVDFPVEKVLEGIDEADRVDCWGQWRQWSLDLGVDVGLMYKAFGGTTAGLRLGNVLAMVYGDTDDKFPATMRIGVAQKVFADRLTLSFDTEGGKWGFGTEFAHPCESQQGGFITPLALVDAYFTD
jgi:hypothetical protein